MSLESILSWIVCGLIVGAIARFLVPGRQSMGLMMTSLLGIAGALVGGFLYALMQGESAQPFSLSGNNWYGWIVSILGAVLLIWAWPGLNSRRTRI
jgi:uncharacterized membrane protein YeaQ/YmgE (transglycosylase-associated protein family)